MFVTVTPPECPSRCTAAAVSSDWQLTGDHRHCGGLGPILGPDPHPRAPRGVVVSRGREVRLATPELPLTRASLLIRLRDRADHGAWNEFVDVYGPVIYGFARKRGLQDADAADMMQDVLRSVSSAIERLDYDPRQGRFRGWLFTITRNRIFSMLTARKGKARATGDSDVQSLLSAQADSRPGLEAEWDLEYRRSQTALAMQQVQGEFSDKIWSAFWSTAVEDVPAADVARSLKMSPGAVYVAKSRVLARIRDVVQRQLDLAEETDA
jgi:RNA polymerase sigma factor (sigma-70 family)